MEDSRISTLLEALKLDEHPFINHLMFVEELDNADGSFILSVMIKDQIEKKHNVILVACHNSWGHFYSIGQKLGYNLNLLKECGRICFLDVLHKIRNEDFLTSSKALKNLHHEIKKQADAWKNEKGICIIVENIGNFLFTNVEGFISFINYTRIIIKERKNSNFILSFHNFPDCLNFDKMAKLIRHLADLTLVLEDLQTGRANDVTGHLTVLKKTNNFKISASQYHYQLQDKSVIVFVPGSRDFFEN